MKYCSRCNSPVSDHSDMCPSCRETLKEGGTDGKNPERPLLLTAFCVIQWLRYLPPAFDYFSRLLWKVLTLQWFGLGTVTSFMTHGLYLLFVVMTFDVWRRDHAGWDRYLKIYTLYFFASIFLELIYYRTWSYPGVLIAMLVRLATDLLLIAYLKHLEGYMGT